MGCGFTSLLRYFVKGLSLSFGVLMLLTCDIPGSPPAVLPLAGVSRSMAGYNSMDGSLPCCSFLQTRTVGYMPGVTDGRWWRFSSDGWGCSAAWEENSWMVQMSALTQSASQHRQMLVELVPTAWQRLCCGGLLIPWGWHCLDLVAQPQCLLVLHSTQRSALHYYNGKMFLFLSFYRHSLSHAIKEYKRAGFFNPVITDDFCE